MMPALDWLQAERRPVLGQPDARPFLLGQRRALERAGQRADLSELPERRRSARSLTRTIVEQVQHLVQNGGADLAALTGPHAEQIRHTFAALQKYHGDRIWRAASGHRGDRGRASCWATPLSTITSSPSASARSSLAPTPTSATARISWSNPSPTIRRSTRPAFSGYVFKYTLPCMAPDAGAGLAGCSSGGEASEVARGVRPTQFCFAQSAEFAKNVA